VTTTRRAFLRAAAVGVLAGSAGCGAFGTAGANEIWPDSVGSGWRPATGTWPTPGYDLRNTQYNPHASGSLAGEDGTPTVQWKRDDNLRQYSTSLQVGAITPNTVYLRYSSKRADEEYLRALDPANGDIRWAYTNERDRFTAPSLLNGVLYAGGDEAVAIDATDGSERWRTDLYSRLRESVGANYLPEEREGFSVSVPKVTPDTVYFTTTYGVHGLDPKDGSERWRLAFDGRPHTMCIPAVDERSVFASGPRAVYSLSGGTTLRRLVGNNGPSLESLTVDGDRLYLTDDAVHTLTLPSRGSRATESISRSGTETPVGGNSSGGWTFSKSDGSAQSSGHTTSLAVADGQVFLGEVEPRPDGGLMATVYALDAQSGIPHWSRQLSIENTSDSVAASPLDVLSAPVVGGETLYVGVTLTVNGFEDRLMAEDSRVVAYDVVTGERAWTTALDFHPTDLAVANSQMYAVNRSGMMAALGV
jgi:hypothetical protein